MPGPLLRHRPGTVARINSSAPPAEALASTTSLSSSTEDSTGHPVDNAQMPPTRGRGRSGSTSSAYSAKALLRKLSFTRSRSDAPTSGPTPAKRSRSSSVSSARTAIHTLAEKTGLLAIPRVASAAVRRPRSKSSAGSPSEPSAFAGIRIARVPRPLAHKTSAATDDSGWVSVNMSNSSSSSIQSPVTPAGGHEAAGRSRSNSSSAWGVPTAFFGRLASSHAKSALDCDVIPPLDNKPVGWPERAQSPVVACVQDYPRRQRERAELMRSSTEPSLVHASSQDSGFRRPLVDPTASPQIVPSGPFPMPSHGTRLTVRNPDPQPTTRRLKIQTSFLDGRELGRTPSAPSRPRRTATSRPSIEQNNSASNISAPHLPTRAVSLSVSRVIDPLRDQAPAISADAGRRGADTASSNTNRPHEPDGLSITLGVDGNQLKARPRRRR